MDKFHQVMEYESITCNKEYKNDSGYHYVEKSVFDELNQFIREFTLSDEYYDSTAIDFFRPTLKRNVGDVIVVKNYVGLIQMKSGAQIEILPKINFDNKKDEAVETKRIFLKMLRSMKDFPCKVFNNANLHVDRMNLYEIFINMYLQEVLRLVRRGLRSAYVEKQENLPLFKGKLLIGEHIKQNAAHRERFFVSYDEFHISRPENRLIKSTLLKLQRITASVENEKIIRQLLTSFEFVEPSSNYTKDFASVKTDRSMVDYAQIIPWSKVFLMNKSFTTFTGDSSSRALLFPMEKVFESYVAQNIKKVFGARGWDVSTQDSRYCLFTETSENGEIKRDIFRLRPDIVVKKGDKIVIMDTKWKRLVDNEYANYGISQADMYQMYAYAKKYNTPDVWLLYPITAEMKKHKDISFLSDDGVSVKIHFVDLSNIEEDLESFHEKISN